MALDESDLRDGFAASSGMNQSLIDEMRGSLLRAERLGRELGSLFGAAQAFLSAQEFSATAGSILDTARSLVSADYGWLSIPAGHGVDCELEAGDPRAKPAESAPEEAAALRRLLAEASAMGKAIFRNGLSEPSTIPASIRPSPEAILVAPLVIEHKAWGFLGLSKTRTAFSDEDLFLTENFATLIAMALRNATAMEEARRENELRMAILANLPIGLAVNSVSPTVDFSYCNETFLRLYRTDRETLAKPDGFWEGAYPDPAFRDEMRARVLRDIASGDPARMRWLEVPITRPGEPNSYIGAQNTLLDERGLMLSTVWDMTETKLAKDRLISANAKLEALWSVTSLSEADFKAISDHILESLARMTGSEFGFYGFVSEDEGEMRIHSWSGRAMADCAMADKPSLFSIKDSGVWAEAVRQRRPFILNDYQAKHPAKRGLPAGHVMLQNLLVVPHFSGGRISSLAAVANRPEPYGQEDVQQIETFLTSIQALVDAKIAEASLKTSEERYRSLYENSMIGIGRSTPEGGIIDMNGAFAAMLGYRNPAELVESKMDADRFYADPDDRRAMMEPLERLGYCEPREVRLRRRDGSEFWGLLSARLSPDPGDGRVCQVCYCIDITERKRAEENNKVLLRELYHRTKNNMNVINAMIGLQMMQVRDPALSAVLHDLQNRIGAMSLVHQMLYRSTDLSHVDFESYARELATQIALSFGALGRKVRIDCEIERLSMLIDIVMPCGLILNELITNSLKHAFKDVEGPRIAVGARREASGDIVIDYRDNGPGFGQGDPFNAGTLGMSSIRALAEHQLRGSIEFRSAGEFRCRITFSDRGYEARV